MAPSELPEIVMESAENAPERQSEQWKSIENSVNELRTENYKLSEDLQQVQLMLDDRGWSNLSNPSSAGLALRQVILASKQIRELMVGNPTMKRGSQLRNSYIWGKGIDVDFPGMSKLALKRINALIDHPKNQACLFSPDAQDELERVAYSDGNAFFLGNNATKLLQRLPVYEISHVWANPDDHEDIWALRRTWTRMDSDSGTLKNIWYYLDSYTGVKSAQINFGNQLEPVDNTRTMFFQKYNGQTSWVWGVPDAIGVLAWSRLYREFLVQGSVMSTAMAQIAYKVTAKTADGMNKATAGIANNTGAGQTVGLMNSMDLAPLSTTGKGYDFASGEPLAAMIATGLEVELEALLSKPSTDNSAGISPATKRAMRARQRSQTALFARILTWMGADPEKMDIDFPEIDDTDAFRQQQSLSSALGSGLFSGDEIRPEMADVVGIELLYDSVPDGFMLPNNSKSVTAGAVVADTSTDGSTTTVVKPTGNPGAPKADGSNAMSNGQGRNNVKQGTQSAGNNDLRKGTTKK